MRLRVTLFVGADAAAQPPPPILRPSRRFERRVGRYGWAVDRENQATCCAEHGVCGVAIEAAATFPQFAFSLLWKETGWLAAKKKKRMKR